MSKPLKLGQRVYVKAVLQRDNYRWHRNENISLEGMITGKRTLWNSEWDDEGWEYPHTRYLNHFAVPVPAYMVAPDLRHFWYVSPDDLEVVE